MKKFFYIITLLLGAQALYAQERGFVINGKVNLPDGYSVGIVCQTDTAYSVDIAHGYVKKGKFTLRGKHMDSPAQGTLMTNNLELIEKNHWPTDSVRWTYNEVFLSNGKLTFGQDFRLRGTQVQNDYNDLLDMGGEGNADAFAFIDKHPKSVVSIYLANKMLQRGYNLTDEQVAHLEKTIQPTGTDPAREKEYNKRISAAKYTTKGSTVADLDLLDTNGNACHLVDVVPKGKYVLIDFWASWCGMCLHAMPEVAAIAEDYKDNFCVVGVSIDTKDAAWRKAMEKHPEPWPQYITTKQGYQALFDKYQVGNGVPYYLFVAPDGKVISSPSHPSDVREMLEQLGIPGPFTLTGEVPGLDEKTEVYLYNTEGSQRQQLATSKVKDGRFELKGQVKCPTLVLLQFQVPTNNDFIPMTSMADIRMMVTPGTMSFQSTLEQLADTTVTNCVKETRVSIQGGKAEQEYQEFLKATMETQLNADQAASRYAFAFYEHGMDDSAPAVVPLKKQDEEAKAAYNKAVDNFVATHPDYAVSAALSAQKMYEYFEHDAAFFDKLYDKVKNNPDTVHVNFIKRNLEFSKQRALGISYTDFTALQPNNKPCKLSSLLKPGKFTLIDFWASWCGPCRKAIPKVKQMTRQFKQLQVVSVSLDEKEAAWRKAMKEEKMPWTQLWLTGDNLRQAAQAYIIQTIPRLLLISPEGKILAVSHDPSVIESTLSRNR